MYFSALLLFLATLEKMQCIIFESKSRPPRPAYLNFEPYFSSQTRIEEIWDCVHCFDLGFTIFGSQNILLKLAKYVTNQTASEFQTTTMALWWPRQVSCGAHSLEKFSALRNPLHKQPFQRKFWMRTQTQTTFMRRRRQKFLSYGSVCYLDSVRIR